MYKNKEVSLNELELIRAFLISEKYHLYHEYLLKLQRNVLSLLALFMGIVIGGILL